MNKCLASENGYCKNIYAFGLKCDGYSNKCRLKPGYDKIENFFKNYTSAVRKAYGIESDKE